MANRRCRLSCGYRRVGFAAAWSGVQFEAASNSSAGKQSDFGQPGCLRRSVPQREKEPLEGKGERGDKGEVTTREAMRMPWGVWTTKQIVERSDGVLLRASNTESRGTSRAKGWPVNMCLSDGFRWDGSRRSVSGGDGALSGSEDI